METNTLLIILLVDCRIHYLWYNVHACLSVIKSFAEVTAYKEDGREVEYRLKIPVVWTKSIVSRDCGVGMVYTSCPFIHGWQSIHM